MQFFPPLTSRARPQTSIVVSLPHYLCHHHRHSSRIFFLPLSRGNRDDDNDDDKDKNENEDEDEASGRIDGLVAETEEEQE